MSAMQAPKRRSANTILGVSANAWCLALLVGALVFVSGGGLAAGGYSLALLASYKLVFNQDRPFEMRWFIVLFATIQNVVAPHLAYLGAYEHHRYYMYVDQQSYMTFAVPAIWAFSAGLLTYRWKREGALQVAAIRRTQEILTAFPRLPFIVLVASFFGPFVISLMPSQAFIGYMLTNLKYSAALLFILSYKREYYYWAIAIVILSILEAVSTSLLHDIILWAVFIGGALCYRSGVRPSAKILVGALLSCCIIVAQAVKNDYRELAWRGDSEVSSALYFDLATEKLVDLASGNLKVSDLVGTAVMRMNQGWIISRIIMNVPGREPFARGDTIGEAVKATLLPRFLYPEKPTAGGRENFRRFTHLEIGPNTSMGIGLFGEAYANFGRLGGQVFLFAYGLGLVAFIVWLLSMSQKYPLILLFMPNVILHNIKTETELLVVLNFLIKSAVFHVAIIWVLTMLSGRKSQHRRPNTKAKPKLGNLRNESAY